MIVHAATQHPMIELRRVHRFFGSTRAVDDVSFDVYRGQVFGFIGPNGAGKTTSMRILATLEMPTYGDAFVDGFSVVNDPDLVRRRLGFMPDGCSLYPNMNCVEYLDFFARSYGLVGKDRNAALRRTLSFTGLDKIASKSITGLSKGMRQRLSLGRAMIHRPSVLILDEPANGLDPRARIELRHLIRQLASEGTTVLVSSHILTELAEMCDQVGIIERGKLLAVGSVEEIYRSMRTATRVRIRAAGRQDELIESLRVRGEVSNVQGHGEWIHLDLNGDEAAQASLVRLIIESGFDLLEFAAHRESLEDVFMKITTGAVQ
ncbi:MAG: ATP-binding cassette domain-containing protein [Planctomycetota bacterium]|jgi:ABC-2 type transport system ATP-binding protein